MLGRTRDDLAAHGGPRGPRNWLCNGGRLLVQGLHASDLPSKADGPRRLWLVSGGPGDVLGNCQKGSPLSVRSDVQQAADVRQNDTTSCVCVPVNRPNIVGLAGSSLRSWGCGSYGVVLHRRVRYCQVDRLLRSGIPG